MITRLRLLMGAAALLYIGPMVAGLGGHGWATLPVFIAIFLLWLIIMKPGLWPRDLPEWLTGGAVLALASRTAVQALLVTFCLGIGRGMGGVLGYTPELSVTLPVAMSFLAIVMGRMIWDPRKSEDGDGILDAALDRLAAGRMPQALTLPAMQRTDTLLAPIGNASDRTGDAELIGHLGALGAELSDEQMLDALAARIETGTAPRAMKRALVLHATNPEVARTLAGHGQPARAFRLAGGDAALLRLFAQRCGALIDQNPAALADCPPTDLLRKVADAARDPATTLALTALAKAQDQALAQRADA